MPRDAPSPAALTEPIVAMTHCSPTDVVSPSASTLYTDTAGIGPDVVLVHGWGMHSGVWEDVAGDLLNDYRVTVLDLSGHGFSRPTKSKTSFIFKHHTCLSSGKCRADDVIDIFNA